MTTPSGPGRAAPAPPGPQVPGAPIDPRLVEQWANALFREAFSTPATTPAQVPPPTESSAALPPRGGETVPGAAGVPGGFAAAPLAAGAAQGVGPTLLPAAAPTSAPPHAPSPSPSLGMPTWPTSGLPSPTDAGGLLPPTSAGSPGGDGVIALGATPGFPALLGVPGAAPPPATAPTMPATPALPGLGTASAAPAQAAAPATADVEALAPADAEAPEEPLYWLATATAAPAPAGCRYRTEIERHLTDDALRSVPQLASPAEAEASRQTEGRGLASPLPSIERLFADAARFSGATAPAGAWPAAPTTAPAVPPAPASAPDAAAGLASAPSWAAAAPAGPAAAPARPPAGPAGSTPWAAVPAVRTAPDAFDVETVRRDFPALQQEVHGRPLVWLDNAATTQKPQAVLDAISRFYARDNSNIHRAAHELARRATEAYENAREVVRRFLNASSAEEIVFVRGTTEAINLVAQSWGRQNLGHGDEIVLTTLEHHANIVPWQLVARERGAVLKVVPITDRGEVVMEEYARLLGPRTRLVAATQVSNSLGTVVPVREMAALAHRHGAPMLVDGAQSVPHLRTDVQDLGADFFVFSGHKVFGPTGIGALYARKALLETMPPWQGGGSMIRTVTFEQSTYADPPAKFEAGTPNVADAVGLAAALEYVERLGIDRLERYEHGLLVYAEERMREVPGLRPVGTAPHKASVLSFVFDGVRVEEVGRYLDGEGIAVRAGHHCAMPSLARFGLTGTVRPSLAFYNTRAEVDRLVEALRRFRHA